MHRHSRLHQRNLFDWIRDCIERGIDLPTDAAIQDRFGYSSPEQARTLLADLADRREIRIQHPSGGERLITLGCVAPLPSRELAPPKPDPTVDAVVAKITSIVRPETPEKQASSEIAPASVAMRPIKRSKPGALRVIGVPCRGALLEAIEEKAISEMIPLGAAGLAFMEAGLLAFASPAPAKPRVPAAVVIAAQKAGEPLDRFVTKLIELGLAARQAEQGSSS